MLTTLAVANYRSLRNLIVPLRNLNVVTGANGSGKSNLYRALRLLADVAQGRVVQSLAREGGLRSTLWAGPETISRAMLRGEVPVQGTPRTKVVNLRMGFAGDGYGYLIDLGLSTHLHFPLDPEIKRECVWHGPRMRPSTMIADRHASVVRLCDGNDTIVTSQLAPFDSMLTHVSDPRQAPELLSVRESIRAWRFYDHFRTDAEAPARTPQIGTHTPVLANDGADLASAILTIQYVGENEALAAVVDDAFPGSTLSVQPSEDSRYSLFMKQPGLLRPLGAAELSDGTLRYLLWIAALLTPRPPELLVLNEPETSLHPELIAPLGRLIAKAATRTQMIVVSHSPKLIESLGEHHAIHLEKRLGQTEMAGMRNIDIPAWSWPGR